MILITLCCQIPFYTVIAINSMSVKVTVLDINGHPTEQEVSVGMRHDSFLCISTCAICLIKYILLITLAVKILI